MSTFVTSGSVSRLSIGTQSARSSSPTFLLVRHLKSLMIAAKFDYRVHAYAFR